MIGGAGPASPSLDTREVEFVDGPMAGWRVQVQSGLNTVESLIDMSLVNGMVYPVTYYVAGNRATFLRAGPAFPSCPHGLERRDCGPCLGIWPTSAVPPQARAPRRRRWLRRRSTS